MSKAITCFEQSGRMAENFSSNSLNLAALQNIGMCKMHLGEIAEAITCFEEVINLARNKGLFRFVVNAQFLLAFLYSSSETNLHRQKAFDLAEQVCLKLSSTNLTLWGQGHSKLFLGAIYRNLRRFEESFRFYNDAIKFSEESHFIVVKAKSFNGLAELYRDLANFEDALFNHFRAIELLADMGEVSRLAEAYYQLGLTYQAMAEIQKSKENFQKAISLFSGMEAPKQVERVRRSMITEPNH